MRKSDELLQRLSALPRKVALPFEQLLNTGQIKEDVLSVVLDAGDLATDSSKLLGFAIAYLTNRSQGVPVHDVIRMAKAQKRRINLNWSAKRWKAEHDRLSRAEALDRLSKENVTYNVSTFEKHLPETFDGYLIRSSSRLGMEGLRQRHCVAGYHHKISNGNCAIASLLIDKTRWTVELVNTGNSEAPLMINQIKSRHNALPSAEVRSRIEEMLSIKRPEYSVSNASYTENDSLYMDNLRRLLPVLRDQFVQSVVVSFDGSGDSGAIDSIFYLPQRIYELPDITVEHVVTSQQFDDGRWIRQREVEAVSMNKAIDALTYEYLEETQIDWYNNDGGYGELVIDVTDGTVSLEVNVRYTESVNEFHCERDIVTGEEI